MFDIICSLEKSDGGFSKALLGMELTVEEIGRLEKLEIERQMRYVDFVTRQGFSLNPGRDDVLAVFDATMLLLNIDYTQDRLHAMLTDVEDNSSQAIFVRRYYNLLSALLADDVDTTIDESRVLELSQQLFGESAGTTSGTMRRSSAVSSLRRGAVVSRESYAASREMSELMEWLLVSTMYSCGDMRRKSRLL